MNRVNEKQFSVNIFLIQRFLSYFDPQSSLSVLFLAKLSKFAKAIIRIVRIYVHHLWVHHMESSEWITRVNSNKCLRYKIAVSGCSFTCFSRFMKSLLHAKSRVYRVSKSRLYQSQVNLSKIFFLSMTRPRFLFTRFQHVLFHVCRKRFRKSLFYEWHFPRKGFVTDRSSWYFGKRCCFTFSRKITFQAESHTSENTSRGTARFQKSPFLAHSHFSNVSKWKRCFITIPKQ